MLIQNNSRAIARCRDWIYSPFSPHIVDQSINKNKITTAPIFAALEYERPSQAHDGPLSISSILEIGAGQNTERYLTRTFTLTSIRLGNNHSPKWFTAVIAPSEFEIVRFLLSACERVDDVRLNEHMLYLGVSPFEGHDREHR